MLWNFKSENSGETALPAWHSLQRPLPLKRAQPRFADADSRAANKRECIEALDEAFAAKTLDEWKAALADFDGVWAPVQTASEVGRDPQCAANGYVQELTDAEGRTLKVATSPVQFNETPPEVIRAPHHGEHTDEVLLEMGLEMDQILDLKVKGAIL